MFKGFNVQTRWEKFKINLLETKKKQCDVATYNLCFIIIFLNIQALINKILYRKKLDTAFDNLLSVKAC